MRSRSARNSRRTGNPVFEKGRASFEVRFWNDDGDYLFDVVDCDHQPGTIDRAFRPNQIFAVGGLPLQLLSAERARQVVDAVEAALAHPARPAFART